MHAPIDRPARTWLKISLQVPEEHSESIAGFLAFLSGNGVEIAASERSCERIIAYLAEDGDFQQKRFALESFLQDLRGRFRDEELSIRQEHLHEEDWGKGWKRHFKAARLTSRLVVKPTWESYMPEGAESIIELDPGMAFGTGLHASTRLALELIEESFAPSNTGVRQALDVGTGTGILAMACALLGADRVLALDNDPDAVRIAVENVRQNRLEERVQVSERDLADVEGCFDLIVVNIIHDTLIEMAPVLGRRLTANGLLILAGILKGEQEKSILAAYHAIGLTPLDLRFRDEWAAMRLTMREDPS